MQIVLANDHDTDQIKEMWKRIFNEPQWYIDIFFNTLYKKENTLLLKDGEKIVSMLQLLECNIHFNGSEIAARYLAGAATDEKYREHGCMERLLNESFNYAKENNIEAVTLIPGVKGFYEKFGFNYFFKAGFEKVKIGKTKNINIRQADISEIKEIYENIAEKKFLSIKRNFDFWKCIDGMYVKKLGFRIAKYEQNYIIYRNENNVLKIYEQMCESDEARDNIISSLVDDETHEALSFSNQKKDFGMIKFIGKEMKSENNYMSLMLN